MIGAMLATRSAPALPQRTLLSPVEREDDDGTTSWKRFCREQGRIAAELFADRMRAYKEDHSTTAAQSDAAMTHEFSASMCEHLAALTTTVAEAHGDMSAPSLVSLNSTLTANSVPEPAATATSPSRQGHKHWWQFFTRGKNKRNVGTSVKRRKHSAPAPGRDIVIDQIVSQLNLNDGWERGRMSWTRCRLVLAKVQGNHQLEIYSPYKNTTPKTTLFCFLIEEVRSSSSLEVPDSDSCFVIKCQNYGEYVFDVSSERAKNHWMSEIERCASSTTNQHMPTSASMNMIGNGNIRSSPLAHSGLQSSAATIQRATSPLLESYRASPTQYPRSNSQQPDEPALIDISTLNPNLPYLSSSSRNNGASASQRRRVRSLYLDSYNVQTDGASTQQRTTPAPISSSASPPLPRRATCSRSTVAALTSPPRELPSLPRDLPPLPPRPLPSPPSSPSREERAASSSSNRELGSPSSSSSVLHPISVTPLESTDSPEASPPIENQMNSNSSSPSLVHPESSDATNSESINRMLSSELSFSSERGLIRQRSLDSSTAHATETSNSYRIDTMEQDGARSDSTFSSAGNLHEVIQDHALSPSALSTPESPITDTASETSSIPLYIETNSSSTADLQLPSYTRHPYQSWATNSTDLDNLRTLSQHPWFHGLISRANATLLVLGNGNNGSGQYLVRQSESREGDFVLTFNCHNRAKHLRLTLDANGCTIQHLWFEDIVTMLDYFKTHPISLETVPMGDEISLTTYIDRSASDAFRTTTVVNVERIQRTPPRRSRSIHVTMTQSASERGSPTHTLSSSAHHSSWRQLFTRQRSSSSHNVRAHATVQRRHSENAGSILDVQARARLSGRDRNSGNRYVWRNY